MKLARMPDGSPEIFHTIQGEGRNTGMPTVFIRSSLCNLHCTWCDTAYTWNWEDTGFEHDKGAKYRREDAILDISEEEVVSLVERFRCNNYVLTGGEPLIHEKNWVKIMDLLGADSHFEIETNGTLFPGDDFLQRINQFNVSPKLANSLVPEEKRINIPVLNQLASTGKADFKFVVHTREDFAEMEGIIKAADLPANRIFLMAKAASAEELGKNGPKVADYAKNHGYRYSDRLHLRLFGAKRGV